MRPILFLYFLHLAVLPAGAQASKQFYFTNYELSTGLPSNQINAIVQDKAGYIWMGAAHGLARFDGIRHKVFRHKKGDAKSIPFNSIQQLNIDRQNRLWLLASNQEAGYFNTTTLEYQKATLVLEDSTLINAPKGFVKTEDGTLFLGVDGKELLVWDEKDLVFKPATAFFPKKPEWNVVAFGQQPGTDKYWAMLRKGVAVYNRTTGRMNYTGQNPDREPLIDILSGFDNLNDLHFDAKNRLWIASWGKNGPAVYCYDLNNNTCLINGYAFSETLKSYYEIRDFVELSDGTIWVKGAALLAYFDEATKRFVTIPSGPKAYEEMEYSTIMAFFEDKMHNIWVGTDGNGLYRFNPSNAWFSNISYTSKTRDKLSEGSPIAFLSDRDGSVLVSVWGEGLYRYDAQFNRLPLGIKGFSEQHTLAAWDMCVDPDGVHAWFACQPGIFHYNMQNRTGRLYNPAIFENRTIRQVEPDKKGNLWFGTQGLGVFKWDAEAGKNQFEKGLYKIPGVDINKPVNKIIIDSKGMVWVATADKGVYVLDPGDDRVLMHFSEKSTGFEQLPEPGASAVLEYNDSIMIISTATHVLWFNRNRNETRILGTDEGISGFIAALEKDKEGNIWMGTTTNLYRFHPDAKTIISFNRTDGMLSDYFILSASHQLPGGRMIFGAGNRLIVFDPEQIRSKTPPPAVTLTDFRINKRSLPLDSLLRLPKIELGTMETPLALDFSPLTFNNWHAIQYKMEGLDKDWVTADKNFQATYAYLPPGTYRFLFRSINADMQMSEEQHQFTLKIRPPFYQAWWFYGLLFLAAGGLLFWIDRERMRRKEAVLQMRNKIAGDLHHEVNITLQNINILSEMANIKADTDPQKAKQFIEQIHQKSRSMIIALDDMLWSLSPDHDRMAKVVERLQQFIESLNARDNTRIELRVADPVKTLRLDMKNRYEVYLLFKEGAQGMLSACPEGFTLELMAEHNQLIYNIYCGNRSYNETALNNLIQRPDLGKRAAAVHAVLNLKKRAEGFVFEMKIPIRRD